MAFALVASGVRKTNDAGTLSLNTTGANLIVICLTDYGNVGDPAPPTDSNGNIWTLISTKTNAFNEGKQRLYYCSAPIVGSGHTFGTTSTAYYPAIAVSAWSGAHARPLDGTNFSTASGNVVTSLQPGSITPSVDGCLIISDLFLYNAGQTVTNPMANALNDLARVSDNNYRMVNGYTVQTTKAAVNPNWSWAGSSDWPIATVVAFKPAVLDSLKAIHIIAHTGKGAPAATPSSVTTDAIDTTGANFLAAVAIYYTPTGAASVTDSKGNTWIALVARGLVSGRRTCIWYCANPIVGTGHTVTFAALNSYPTLCVAAFSNVNTDPFYTRNGIDGGSTPATSTPTGSVMPYQSRQLLIAGVCNQGSAFSIDSGFIIIDSVNYTADHMGGGLAYLIQGMPVIAANPTWSWTGSSYFSSSIAVFRAMFTTRSKPVPSPFRLRPVQSVFRTKPVIT